MTQSSAEAKFKMKIKFWWGVYKDDSYGREDGLFLLGYRKLMNEQGESPTCWAGDSES